MSRTLPSSAVIALIFGAGGAMAERNLSIYPAAQCAALWLGYADYADLSAYLDSDPRDQARADAYRKVAYRLAPTDRAEIDAYVATQRPMIERMMEAMIYGGDGPSRDVFERLSETCKDFGQDHPETRDLS